MDADATEKYSSRDELWRWRIDRFLDLGFNVAERRTLADAGASPTVVEDEYLNKGCSRELALAILT